MTYLRRCTLAITSALVIITVSSATASAQRGRDQPVATTPYLMISPYMSPDQRLASRIADTVRALVEQRISRRSLYVLPRHVIEGTLTGTWLTGPFPLSDVRELAKVLRASTVLEIGAEQTPSGIRLKPILIRGRNEPVQLSPIEARTLRDAAVAIADIVFRDTTLLRPYPPHF